MDYFDLPPGQKYSKIIYPPPDSRHVIETTALFVFRNGVEFEETFMERGRKGKFDFLRKSDPFHAFYQRELTRFIEGGDPLDSLESYKYPQGITADIKAANRLQWEQRMQRLKDERAAKIPEKLPPPQMQPVVAVRPSPGSQFPRSPPLPHPEENQSQRDQSLTSRPPLFQETTFLLSVWFRLLGMLELDKTNHCLFNK